MLFCNGARALFSVIHILILYSGLFLEHAYLKSCVFHKQSYLSFFFYGNRYLIFRNLVVAPILEEIIFRGNALSLMLSTGYTPRHAILVTSFTFGACFSLPYSSGHYPVFMFLYTSLFGILVSYVYLRTDNLPYMTNAKELLDTSSFSQSF
ncbi:uncharacterized protein [Blastocystis hominis]|uniref:intramembrane prenyl-peptidase Rce1 n=1 Tax=Blastocystis hominis TaxID=12968 RepID=D8MBH1_BLAHO|nr:uncharacterized protein [Blastocystis hominis]CBK25410.2 unnamed protein product [Blastocystis hominis]|eukprot:XP_012899458.1 uncharacterized protein [Blastocystis hominis]